ncbi:MAG: S-layer homology domain-containing protein, partial [Clostridia bacterium]|nr:S-layer homology domain-containing protein [Clostridia bacterium]
MKKQLFKACAVFALIAAVTCALVFGASAVELSDVVFLKGGATGNGYSANDPVGTWQDAFEAINLKGDSTIVICGPTTMTKMYNYGKHYNGSVTITSMYDGVDYRQTDGAILNIGVSGHFICNGDTKFENINLNATGGRWLLVASHNHLAMGEGITVTGEGLTGGKIKQSIAIVGGYQNSVNNPPLNDTKDVNITVLSGSMYYIVAFNREFEGTFLGNANIYIGGDADVATLHCTSDTDGSVVGNVNITLTDNANIGTFYGGTANVSVGDIKLTWLSGTIGNIFDWNCRYIPTKALIFEGKTTIIASEKAQRRSNFATIAAMFDNVEKYQEPTTTPTTPDTPKAPAKPEGISDFGCARGLYTLGLAQGYDSTGTNFGLEDKMTRIQTVVQVIRFLGKEAEVKAGSYTHPFTDVPAWANNYVGYAYANNITSGRSATKFDPDGVVDEMQFLTFMLRAVGYSDAQGDFVWNNPFALAKQIGMGENDSAAATFVRGDAFRISFNALYATAKSGTPVYNNLINAGVFNLEQLDKAASAALSAKEETTVADKSDVTVENGYYVLSKEAYRDKTTAAMLSQFAGVLTGYEHVYQNGAVRLGLPDEWFVFLEGPYAAENPYNKHEDKHHFNETLGLYEVWIDDDYSLDFFNLFMIDDMYEKYGTFASKTITDSWVDYCIYDMGGGHHTYGAYKLATKGYFSHYLGNKEFGNMYSVHGEPLIENETLGMIAAGMPSVAIDITNTFASV